jgi:hypothetical protein
MNIAGLRVVIFPRRLTEFHLAFRHRNRIGKLAAASAEKVPRQSIIKAMTLLKRVAIYHPKSIKTT